MTDDGTRFIVARAPVGVKIAPTALGTKEISTNGGIAGSYCNGLDENKAGFS
jgi:hypothetical protein